MQYGSRQSFAPVQTPVPGVRPPGPCDMRDAGLARCETSWTM